MIKGLLKKDLYNLASYKASLIIIVLFCGIAIVGTEAINWGPMFILLFIIIVITAGAGFLIMKANLNINMEMLENFINQFGLVLLVALMIIMYSISYVISYRIYKNKEE